MATGSYLLVITLNVNGLNAPTKRQRLAEWIQKQDPYICCLQETHLKTGDTYRLKVKGWKKDFPCKLGPKENRRHSTLKGHSQNLTGSGTQGSSHHLKGSWIWLTCCSWRASQRGRRQLELILGIQTLAAAVWGAPTTMWTLVLASVILKFSF